MRQFMRVLLTTIALAFFWAIVPTFAEDTVRIDLQMENVFFKSGSGMVHAFIYKPQGKGPFPAVIFNQATREPYYNSPDGLYPFESIAKWCTSHGYVLFIPDRPGHELLGKQLGEFAGLLDDTSNLSPTNRAFLEGFDLIGKDVLAGVAWLTNQFFVDTKRVAMMGHSTGAMQALLLSTKKSPVRGFVAFSPGAKIWKTNLMVRSLLVNAARRAREPIFLIQAQNDFNLGPSEDIGTILTQRQAPNTVKVYSPFGANPNEAIMLGVHGTSIWGNDVASFFETVWK